MEPESLRFVRLCPALIRDIVWGAGLSCLHFELSVHIILSAGLSLPHLYLRYLSLGAQFHLSTQNSTYLRYIPKSDNLRIHFFFELYCQVQLLALPLSAGALTLCPAMRIVSGYNTRAS